MLLRPVSDHFPINQGFGANPTRNNPHPVYGDYQSFGHLALDFKVPLGTPVRAAHDGVIDLADWGYNAPEWVSNKWMMSRPDHATGIGVFLDRGDGYGTTYNHLLKTARNAGGRVRAGDIIGYSGSTGRSGGPHLHFELVRFPAPNDGRFYGRIDPAFLFTLSSTIDPIEGFLMALNDKEQHELLTNTRKSLSESTNAKVSAREAVRKLDAVLHQLTNVPLPGGGTTEQRTKIKYQASELHQIKASIREIKQLLTPAPAADQSEMKESTE